jgi:hypothetical protein
MEINYQRLAEVLIKISGFSFIIEYAPDFYRFFPAQLDGLVLGANIIKWEVFIAPIIGILVGFLTIKFSSLIANHINARIKPLRGEP